MRSHSPSRSIGSPPDGLVFISHSTTDGPLVERLVHLLQVGCGVPHDRIVASSVDGHGVPAGYDLVNYLRERIRETTLPILAISPSYLDSVFCTAEFGAVWVLGQPPVPLLIPPVIHTDLSPIIGQLKTEKVNDAAALDRMRDRIQGSPGINAPGTSVWNNERRKFTRGIQRHLTTIAPGQKARVHDLEQQVSLLAGERDRASARLQGLEEERSTADARAESMSRFQRLPEKVHAAFHALRDAAFFDMLQRWETGKAEHQEEFYGHLRASLAAIEEAYKLITDKKCHACIKAVRVSDTTAQVSDAESVLVYDLCRSQTSRQRRKRSEPDRAVGNTDFEELFTNDKRYFLGVDLGTAFLEGRYHNSHWQREGFDASKVDYLSTIVWPIRRALNDANLAKSLGTVHPDIDLLGFLCIDSKDPAAFSDEDVETGMAFADALYIVLRARLPIGDRPSA